MGFKNKNAQNHVQEWVVQGEANKADVNNPQVGDTVFVLDTCKTYVYKGDPDPLVNPSWMLYISPAGAGSDDQTAAEVPFSPNGDIAATDVQAAIQEVRDDADTKLGLKADLVGGKIPIAQIPDRSIPDFKVVADAAARLALTVQEGDEAKQTDDGSHWIYDGSAWAQYPSGGGGDTVTNPAVATDNAIARFDGATGKLIADSSVLINDDGSLNLPVFGAARTAVDGDAWIEKIGAGPVFLNVKVGGVEYGVELGAA